MSTAPFSIKSSVVFLASELGLAAFVTYFQQEWYVFAGLSVLLFIGLLLYNYKRRVEPWHLILTGLIGVVIFSSTALAGVIWLRYWRPNTTVLEFSEQVYVQPKLPEKSSDFNWGFERHKGYNFIGMSQMDGKIVIHQFQAQGRNLTPDLLVKVRGHVRSDRTGKEFEIVFNLAGQMAKADEINPIPVNAIVDTRAYFSDDEKPISMEKGLQNSLTKISQENCFEAICPAPLRSDEGNRRGESLR